MIFGFNPDIFGPETRYRDFSPQSIVISVVVRILNPTLPEFELGTTACDSGFAPQRRNYKFFISK